MVLPIHHQMDEDFCSVVTQDLKTNGAHWERRLATPTLWQQLPADTGLYMFVFASTLSLQLAGAASNTFSPTWVLYVGRAGSPDSHRTIKDRYKGEYGKYVGADPEVLWNEHSCLSGCHPHPLNVGWAHSPEYSPSKVGAATPPAIASSERNALKG